jgi:hypothetical protein
LLVIVRFLFKLPKEAPNSLRNASKLFKRGDWCSRRGTNHAKIVPDNKVPMNLTWVKSSSNGVDEVG